MFHLIGTPVSRYRIMEELEVADVTEGDISGRASWDK